MNNYEENKILEVVTGSNLYGTNTPSSDKDYVDVMIGDINTYLGLEKVKEVDLSIKSKDENGENNKNAVDRKLYELRNFIGLAMQNNPNLIEILFVNKENIVSINDFGNRLLENKHLFPWKGAKQKFLGYAFSQKHHMIIRTESFFELNAAFNYISENLHSFHEIFGNKLLAEFRDKNLPFLNFTKGTSCSIGDLSFDISRKMKDVVKILNDRISKATNRAGLMEKYGYDTKFASHLVRLLLEGKELLLTGEIKFPLSYRNFLLEIKQGKYSIKHVLDLADSIESEFEEITNKSKLPSKPKYDEINNLLIDMVKESLF